jgi:hypothetical protein
MSSPWAVQRLYEINVLELAQALRLTLAQSTDAACCLMASLPKTGVGRGLPDRDSLEIARERSSLRDLLVAHALVTNGNTDFQIPPRHGITNVPNRHQTGRTQPVDRLCRRRLWEPSRQRRRSDFVRGRRSVTDTGNDVAYDVAVYAGLVHSLLEERVEQAVGRGVAECALLGSSEGGSFGELSASTMSLCGVRAPGEDSR